jgi:hypothetical protein
VVEQFSSRRIPIHPTSWNSNSANFVLKGFSEVFDTLRSTIDARS